MLLYRVEDDNGSGPYMGTYQRIDHPSWYGTPDMDRHGREVKLSSGSAAKGPDGRYTHVLAMESLEDLLMIFKPSSDIGTEVSISVYKVHKNATKELYSYRGDSKQIHFNRTKATLVNRFKVLNTDFRGNAYTVCPQHLCQATT